MSKNRSLIRFIVLGFALLSISALSVVAENSWVGNIFGPFKAFWGETSESSTGKSIAENSPALSNGPIIFQRGFAAAADIPFNQGGQLYKIDPASGTENSFGAGSQPNYSIDGTIIAFIDSTHLFVTSASTFNPAGIVIPQGGSPINALYPKVSPDNSQVVFQGFASVNSNSLYKTFIINTACTSSNAYDTSVCNKTVLAFHGNIGDNGTTSSIYPSWYPTLTPSGPNRTGKILFVKTSDSQSTVDARNATGDIYEKDVTIATNGVVTEGASTNLTNNPAKYSFPTYSHDGTRIAVVKTDAGGSDSLYIMNSNGSSPVSIINNGGSGQITVLDPAWSPDDARIAFSDSIELFQITTGTLQISPVTSNINAAADLFPSWAPIAGSPTPTPTPTPLPATLIFDGKLRDRVSRHHGSAGLAPDGDLDGTFTVTPPPATAGKTLASIDLCQKATPCLPSPADNNINRWDTIPGDTNLWVLGVDYVPEGASLVNNANDGSVSGLTVSNQGAFKLYAADATPSAFVFGSQFSVTVTFADGSSATASTTINRTQADV